MTKSPPTSGLRQAEMILALSLATDLGTGRPMEWVARKKMPACSMDPLTLWWIQMGILHQ